MAKQTKFDYCMDRMDGLKIVTPPISASEAVRHLVEFPPTAESGLKVTIRGNATVEYDQ